MIHEILEISGSHNITGSLLLPLLTEDTIKAPGSVAYQNGKTYVNDGTTWSQLAETTTVDSTIEYLVVAGGGGGGGWGGGGGAGGLLSGSFDTVTSGSTFTMTVGAGSAGGQLSQNAGAYVQGVDGSNSSLAGSGYTTVTATGGGGGGRHNGYTVDNGRPGGSGGGAGLHASNNNVVGGGSGGSGTSGQGFAGGSGGGSSSGNAVYYRGGGGGGASQVGQDGTGHNSGGQGGSGSLSTITGNSVRYAGGGGSHTDRRSGAVVAPGGPGGGGAGGGYVPDTHAVDGTANTGGGGGGSYGYANSHQGGGGSGVVVVSYNSGSLMGYGGLRKYTNTGKIAHIFNSTGTFTVSNAITQTYATKDVLGDSSCLALYQFEDNANELGGTSGRLTGNAATFNGSSSILTMNQATVLGNTFGVTFWINIPSTPPDNDYIFWFGYGQNVGLYIDSSGVLQVYIGSYSANESYATSQTISTSTWYHVVLTCDSSTVTCYVNGVNKGTGGLSGGQNTTYTYQNVIGGYNSSSPSNHISMKMEDFRIYNRHITSTEASNLYNDTDISSTSLANRYIMKTDFTDSVGSRDLTNSNVGFSPYDGTASNMTYTQGYINQSAVFNGSSSRIDLGNQTFFHSGDFSVSLWFKNQGNDSAYQYLMSQKVDGQYESTSPISLSFYGTSYSSNPGKLYFAVGGSYIRSNTALAKNVWHHVVVTIVAGGAMKIYANGSLDSNAYTETTTRPTPTQNLAIGANGSNNTYNFNGSIDQVRIFNKALTASEVLTVYKE